MANNFKKKDCEKIYISKKHYDMFEFVVSEFISDQRKNRVKNDFNFTTEDIMKVWIEDYIEKSYDEMFSDL